MEDLGEEISSVSSLKSQNITENVLNRNSASYSLSKRTEGCNKYIKKRLWENSINLRVGKGNMFCVCSIVETERS